MCVWGGGGNNPCLRCSPALAIILLRQGNMTPCPLVRIQKTICYTEKPLLRIFISYLSQSYQSLIIKDTQRRENVSSAT